MKTKQLLISLALGLGLTLALLWLLGRSLPTARAQGPDGPQTHFVAPGGDCGSVTPCYASVQAAVKKAGDGDIIKVAAGIYTGVQEHPAPTGYDGPPFIKQVVYIDKTIAIRGGYTTTNAFADPPDPKANTTVLDAQEQGRVIFITGDPSASSGQAIGSTIEGLHITGGDAAGLGGGPAGHEPGGGVYVITATITMSNNRVFSNTATIGGGLYVRYSPIATLSRNTFISNTARHAGGGLLMANRISATLSDNTFISNTAKEGGGLKLVNHISATLSDNTFISNTAYHGGGGLFLAEGSTARLLSNDITANTTSGASGGLWLALHSTATLISNTITANTAITGGGGVLLAQYCTATLTNTIIADNKLNAQPGIGAGLLIADSTAHLLHTTIARNSGGDGSGIHMTERRRRYSTVALTNTILVSHTVGITATAGNTATLETTLWGTGPWANDIKWGGAGTIHHSHDRTGDPAFVAPDAGDYHVGPGSAALDAGIDAGVDHDIDGDVRPFDGDRDGVPKFDIGADELVPHLDVTKQASPDAVQAGQQLTYTLRVTNTGHVTLTATITDTLPARVTPSDTVTYTPVTIAPGKVWAQPVVVTVEMGYRGPLTNVVEVTTEEGATGIYTETSTSLKPSIAVDKEPSVDTARVGETITYTYTVKNIGDSRLTDVSADDDPLGPISLAITILEPGQVTTGTATYVVRESDLPGPIANAITATGRTPMGDVVKGYALEGVDLVAIQVVKEASADTAHVGETIVYVYTVTNTGNEPLTDVSADDDRLGAIRLGTTKLAREETTTGTATYVVQESDLPGPLTNTVTVTGTPLVGYPVTDTHARSVNLTSIPAIEVAKEASVSVANVGETILYTYKVENVGNVTLGEVRAEDDRLGAISLGTTTLAPGDITIGTATYVVQESDLPGPLVNQVTATARTPVGAVVMDDAIALVDLPKPAIVVDKEPSVDTARVGETIIYTYTVANTGNVTLADVKADDNRLGVIHLGTTTLAPGKTTAGTATHLVQEGDLPGPLTNTVTVAGTPSVGDPVDATDSVAVTLTSNPAINVVKKASVTTANVGEAIIYTYRAENSGDVTLTDVSANDDRLGAVRLGTTTLAPGDITTGTAAYMVQKSDLPGPLVNAVTASGRPPVGDEVTDYSVTSVDLLKSAIQVVKETSVDTASVGETITYTYTVKNIGDVTLSDVRAEDDRLGAIHLGTTTLAPGGIITGSATYVVQEGDLPGPLTNAVTASGRPPVGDDVTDSSVASVDLLKSAIQVVKEASVTTASVGETITYTYVVANTGDVKLTSINASDDRLGAIHLSTTTLAPGEITTGSATYVLQKSDLPGPLVNTVTVIGTSQFGDIASGTDGASVILRRPTICVPALVVVLLLLLGVAVLLVLLRAILRRKM